MHAKNQTVCQKGREKPIRLPINIARNALEWRISYLKIADIYKNYWQFIILLTT